MEKAKIDQFQLFVLIILFETGTSFAIPLAAGAGNDAWIAIFISCIFGILLFQVYYQLYALFPNELPSSYFNKILGRFFGNVICFLYLVYFTYISAVVLRDFGDLLLNFAYVEPRCQSSTE